MSIDIFPPVSPPTYSAVPTGAIMDFAGINVPSGWLLCDGSVVSRTLYPALFAALSTAYGVGDGSTTFGLPNFSGRMALGAGVGRVLAVAGGAADGQVPTHTHGTDWNVGDHAHGFGTGGISANHTHQYQYSTDVATTAGAPTTAQRRGGAYSVTQSGTVSVDHTHSGTTNGASGGAYNGPHYHNVNASGVALTDINLPPYLVVNKIIKV